MKIVNTVIISSLPIIINTLRTTLLTSGILAKIAHWTNSSKTRSDTCHTSSTELEAVGSTPVITIIIVPRTKIKRYKTTNESIEILVFSAILFPFSLMNEIDFG